MMFVLFENYAYFNLLYFYVFKTVMNIGDKHGGRSNRSRKKRRKPYKITGIESMNSNSSKVFSMKCLKNYLLKNFLGFNYIQ